MKLNGFAGEVFSFKRRKSMKKRKIDPLEEIMSNPYYQLRDDYNYAEKVKGTISFGQYSMKYWALERDIVLDETKSEVTEEMFVKAIMDARKEGEILNDEDEVNGARKIRRKVISHLNVIFCGKAKCKSQIKIGINTQLTLKNIVFFNWILKTNAKTLAKAIERIEGKKNDWVTKISESRDKTKTAEDYYKELLVRGLNSLKENEISPELVEKRIRELYPDIKEEPKSEIEDGLTTNKTEGDHMTPEGTFPIYFAFSTKAKNTKIAFETISEDSVWVCDPEYVYYNTLQSKNNPDKDWTDKGGAENMYPKFSKGSSNACICFGFNGDGWSPYGAVAYGGSALFIDGVGENGKMNSGYGDIKISGKDMTKLLSYLDSDYNPTITIRAAQ